jgi:hypothetical protein
MKKVFITIGLIATTAIGWGQSLWLNGGTTINGTKSFDMFCGGTDGNKIGGYFMLGIGEGDYELTGAEDYTGYVSISQANSWGDPIVGYGTKTGLFIFGGGVIIGIKNNDEKINKDWLLVGLEGGSDGPIYQVRFDPYYILGNGNYAIADPSIEPTKVFNLRGQYVKELNHVLLGVGGVVGSHPGFTLNLGLKIS